MARSRNIKPGFFTNDVLAELPALTRLLFAGLWVIADREGRLEDRPKKIRAEVLPYDSCDADAMLDALQEHGFIRRYSVGGQALIQILAWHKHQNPHVKEAASNFPAIGSEQAESEEAPDKHGASTMQEQCEELPEPEPAGLIPDSLNLIPDSRGKPPRKRADPIPPKPDDVTEQVWKDWVALRTKKRTTVGETVVAEARREASLAGISLDRFLAIWCLRGSQGLEASWLKPHEIAAARSQQSFNERDREAGMRRWEEMTGRAHPDRAADVTVIEAAPLSLGATA